MKKVDRAYLIASLSVIVLIFICFEKKPLSFWIERSNYLFLNSFFGYKFFTTHITLFRSDIIILVLFTLSIFNYRMKDFFLYKSSKYLLLFLFTVAISLIFSYHRFYFSHLLQFFSLIITFLFFASVVRVVNESNVGKFLMVLSLGILAVSLFEAFIGLYQYFMQQGLGLKKFHEPDFIFNNGLAAFDSEGGRRWVFDNLFKTDRGCRTLLRAVGTLSHANIFGAFMFFSSLATVYLYTLAKKKWISSFLVLALFVQVFSIWVSYSRAAIFSFLLTFILLLFLYLFKVIKYENISPFKIRNIIILSFVFSFLSLILLCPQIHQRGGIISYPKIAKMSDQGRVYAQNLAFEITKKNPLTGIGFNNFYACGDIYSCNVKIGKDGANAIQRMIHNIFLLVVSEEGVLGICAFLLFILSIYKATLRKKMDLIPSIFLVYLTGLLFSGLFDFILLIFPIGKFMFFLSTAMLSSVGFFEKKSQLSSSAVETIKIVR